MNCYWQALCMIRINWQKFCGIGITYFYFSPWFHTKIGVWKLDLIRGDKVASPTLKYLHKHWQAGRRANKMLVVRANRKAHLRRNLIHQITSRAVGRSENLEVGASSIVVGIICPPPLLVGIGLTDLPKTWGAMAFPGGTPSPSGALN